ncbi:MAG: hypothetical protein ACM3XZ_06430 [Betaproteobacteria bacterium]
MQKLARDDYLLPLTVVEGRVIFTGFFSPSRLDYEIKRQSAARWEGGAGGQAPALGSVKGGGEVIGRR